MKNNLELQTISGRILADTLQLIRTKIKTGVTGLEIDKLAKEEIEKRGGIPAFTGFDGYKFAACISLNNTLVHGLPNNQPFQPGDVVSIDLGVNYKGWLTDSAITVAIEPISNEVKNLIKGTEVALIEGIKMARAGNRVGDISWKIQEVANQFKLGIAKDLAGHGITKTLHEPPTILNYGKKGTGPILKAGMTIAIEPMFALYADNPKTDKTSIFVDQDGWSIVLEHGNIGAHSEHTIQITNSDPIILTQSVDIKS